MLLLVYLAMACTLRYECDPVESGIAGSHVTVLDCQLRGAIVCGPRRLTKTWNRLVPVAARSWKRQVNSLQMSQNLQRLVS